MGYIGAGPTRFNTADDLTVTGDAEFNGNLTVKGTTTTIDSVTVQNFDMGDNDKIRLGDSQDLVITHDGTDSIINEAGTGSLKFQYGGTDGVVFDSSGNVGIGTVSPDFKIEIVGGTNNGLHIKDAESATVFGGLFTQSANLALVARSNHALTLGTNDAERMRIDSSGNVGIGTTTNNQSSSTKSVTLNAASGMSAYELRNADVFSGYLGNNGTNMYLVNAKNGSLGLYTNNTERMHLTSTGNVGIGGSPTSKLSVVSGTNAGITVNDGTVNTILFNTSSANGSVGTTTNHPMAFYANNAERMRIDSSGNVGINTATTLGAKLFVSQGVAASPATSGNMTTGAVIAAGVGSQALNVGTDADGVWYNAAFANNAGVARIHRWLTGGSERMRIDSSGRVTMPYQPSFAATRNQGDVSNSVYVYPNVYHNIGGHYNNSNGRFTAPVTGSYFISANHMTANNGTYNNYEYQIRVNGSVFQRVYSSNGGVLHHRWNWHGVAYLQAGDYVDVFIPSGFFIYGQSSTYQHFSGYLIG